MDNLRKLTAKVLVAVMVITSVSVNGNLSDLRKVYADTMESEPFTAEENIDEQNDSNVIKNGKDKKPRKFKKSKDTPKVIVKYKSGNARKIEQVKEDLTTAVEEETGVNAADLGLESVCEITDSSIEVLAIEDESCLDVVIEKLEQDENVEYVQPNYTFELLSLPDDPYFEYQWALKNSGQDINGQAGTENIDVNATTVWEKETDLSETVVGVLDTGIDANHPELSGKTVDGWDFANDDESTFDKGDVVHGTQISGIIAASHDGVGIVGIAPNVKIMPLKFIEGGVGYTSDAIAAIEYARNNGVKIINCSWGSDIYNPALKDIMEESEDILFICAAGNNGSTKEIYPAAFDLPNVISVASVNNNGELGDNSNYGAHVNIAAPGVDIYTTGLNGSFGYTSGTSMAAAYVTGAAGMLNGKNPDLPAAQAANSIRQSAKRIEGLDGKAAYGMLDVAKLMGASASEIDMSDLDFEEGLPEEVLSILNLGVDYMSLDDYQKALLFEYLYVREDTMTACAQGGLSIKDSIPRAIIMQQLSITLNDVNSMVTAFGSLKSAKEQALLFNSYQRQYVALNGEEQTELVKLIVNGYNTQDVVKAFIVSKALEVELSAITIKGEADLTTGDLSPFSQDEADILKKLAEKYRVKLQFLSEYITDSQLTAYELEAKISECQTLLNMFFDNENIALADDEEQNYPEAPYQYRSGSNETINLNTGSLLYEENILSLPGRNGLDLDITIQYDSSRAIASTSSGRVWGAGWSVKQTRINIAGSGKYLQLANGASYLMQSGTNAYKLVNYTLSDISLKDDKNAVFPDSKYILSYADGRKEYFDGTGRLIVVTDKFNNSIKYKYTYENTAITDSTGKIVTIEWATTDKLVFTLPDGYTVSCYMEMVDGHKCLTKKENQLGEVTKYNYSTAGAYVNDIARRVYNEKVTDAVTDGIKVTYKNLTKVTYPTGLSTEYTYEKGLGNYGKQGLAEYYRIASRKETVGTTAYNSETYSYSQTNYTGYPRLYDNSKQSYTKIISISGKKYRYYDCVYTEGSFNSASYNLPAESYSTTVTSANGVSKTYDFDNKHLKTKDTIKQNDNRKQVTTYTYNSDKLPEKVVNTTYGAGSLSFSATSVYQYDGRGNVTAYWSSLADGDTNKTEYKTTLTYDPTYNMLTSKTYKKDADTTIKEEYTLVYGNIAVSESKIFENGVLKSRSKYDYDQFGNIQELKEFYEEGSYITTKIRYYDGAYVQSKTIDGISKIYEYDDMGRVSGYTDGKGNRTSYEHDRLGRLTKTINPDGTYSTSTYNNAQNTLVTQNEKGARFKYTYDPLGNLKSIVDTETNSTLNSFNYDATMRLVEQFDANGTKTEFAHDYADRITSKYISQTGYKESYVYQDAFDANTSRVTKTVEGGGAAPSVKTAAYTDRFGRLVKDSIFDGTKEYFNTYSYDYLGNKISELSANDYALGSPYTNKFEYDYSGKITKLTNTLGEVYKTSYDLLGRKTSTTDPKGNVAKYTYDSFNRLEKQETPFEGGSYAEKTYVYDNNGNVTSQTVSSRKPIEKINPDPWIPTYNILPGGGKGDPLPTTPDYNRTDFEYNNRNFMTKVTAFNGSTVESYTEYIYDAVGNKKEMRTANGTQVTKYEYDRFKNMEKLTDALGQVESYKYDLSGNLKSKTDRNGVIISNAYDKQNRLTNVSAANAGDTKTGFMTYTYAANGAKLTEENENLRTTYAYDNFGRLIKESDSDGAEKQYTYDLANNRKTFVLSLNGAVKINAKYEYDSLNRLTKVYDNGILSVTYTYDQNGNRESMTYPNGITTTYEYNKANLVTSLVNKNGSTVLSSYTYTYYLDGNQATKTDNAGTKTSYTYDGLGRLVVEAEVSPSGTIIKLYTFDKAGNRKTMTVNGTENYVTTYAYDANNRLLTETTVKEDKTEIGEYTYDPNGNQLSKLTGVVTDVITVGDAPQGVPLTGLGIYELSEAYENGFTYELDEYDVFNRLVGVQKDGKTAKYAYKADGLRLSKEVDGQKTTHIWDGGNIVLDVGVNNDRYIRGINLIKSDSNGFYIYNAHGDVVQLSDGIGAVTKNYHYDAFGVETNKDEADNNPFRYCAEYFDKETDTIYLRARYYSPRLGRFLTQDPIRNGLNWYTYANANPIRFFDPSGYATQAAHDAADLKYYDHGAPSKPKPAGDTSKWGRAVNSLNELSKLELGDLIARTIYGECGGYNKDNMNAIAWTIINRQTRNVAGNAYYNKGYYAIIMTKVVVNSGMKIGEFAINGIPQYAGLTGEKGQDGYPDALAPDTSSDKWGYAKELAEYIISAEKEADGDLEKEVAILKKLVPNTIGYKRYFLADYMGTPSYADAGAQQIGDNIFFSIKGEGY